MKGTTGIYIIQNILNNKCYVGSTKRFSRRKYEHFKYLRSNTHINNYLQNSFNKHGEGMFKFFIVEECKQEDLIERELFWIEQKKSLDSKWGYNLSTPLMGGGCIHSDETLEYIKRCSYEQHYGTITKEEDYTNWKEKQKKKKLQKEERRKNRRDLTVYQLDKYTGEIVRVFPSPADTYIKMGYKNVKKIQEVLYNNIPSYKGFVYIYKDEYKEDKNYIVKESGVVRTKGFKETTVGGEVNTFSSFKELLITYPTYKQSSITTAISKGNTYKKSIWKRI